MNLIRAKKYLGQHFLKDKNIAKKIVDSIDSSSAKVLLEVGPGMGSLTEYLIEKVGYEFVTVEIDQESVEFLTGRFPSLAGKIIKEDFLKLNLSELFPDGVTIVGNFPYNISSQILFRVYEYRDHVPEVIGMFQKEVAERICSGPGSKNYGILSVLLQAFYSITYLFDVPPQVFSPPPKVTSAVIKLVRNSTEKLDCDEKLFFKVVKSAFNHRRKILRNSLSSLGIDVLPEFAMLRPEQLTTEQFVVLTSYIQSKNTLLTGI